ncbi:unnamed protein product, partial [Brenthis ino]
MKPMYLIKIKGVLMLMVLHIKGSKVIDEHDQKGLYVEDYCPSIGVCEEGSHIMCTHYNPQWDPELATLAKLWANQCIYGQDRCRATKKYPDPGQECSLTRFTIPDWTPIVRRNRFNYTGFSLEKVKYGIISALEGFYRTKNRVNIEKSMNKDGRWAGYINPIIQLIQGSSTHVGCGLSIYQDFVYAESDQLILNVISYDYAATFQIAFVRVTSYTLWILQQKWVTLLNAAVLLAMMRMMDAYAMKVEEEFHPMKSSKIIEAFDTKLISLLNQLEEEAKTIKLGNKEKDILDKKIKKIYSKFADKLRSSRNRDVEARNGNIIPLESLFDSVERRHLKNAQVKYELTGSYENGKTEYPKFKRRNTKKKHKAIKHKNLIHQDSNTNQEHKKNKKRKKAIGNKRFVKTTLKDADSKMSSSNEIEQKRKPVDIIVHIKMND